ncbi:MAG: DUF1743 domain-containing protein [Thermoplasmata archaeon]|nr:MAG: DUF1743 domain-containing protein [Thermoplasmata archaeon]
MNKGKSTDDEYWVSPFEQIVGVVDRNHIFAQIYEYHSRNTCRGASAWVAYHYPRTSTIVSNSDFDGARTIFTLKLGKGKLDLKPSISPAGIESAELAGDELKLTYAGLAGGGVGIARSRALARNVKDVKIISPGGGSKLGRAVFTLPLMYKIHVGIDDTDTKEIGATWSLSNEIGYQASKKSGVEYLNHTIVQLYPQAPGKTKNCVATVLTFGVRPNRRDTLIEFIKKELTTHSVSDDTGMAVWEGIKIPTRMRQFSNKCRTGIVTLKSTKKLAEALNIQLTEITGQNGLIGATAALSYAEKHLKAVKLP